MEAYLKEIANHHVDLIHQRILSSSVPLNIIMWSLDNKLKEKDLVFIQYNIPISQKDIDYELSGNPFRI